MPQASTARRGLARDRPVLQNLSSVSPILHGAVHSDSNVTLWMSEASPEEEIIRARSRCHRYRQLQQLSVCCLQPYDNEVATGDFLQMTPVKERSLLELSRKRLRLSSESTSFVSLSDSYASSPTQSIEEPQECARRSLEVKRCRRTDKSSSDSPLSATLHAYSSNQLAQTISDIVRAHPELETEVRESLELPSLDELEARLSLLKRAVYRAFPSMRWQSTRDSFCYRRVKGHLDVFKTTCLAQLRRLVESTSWDTVLRYIVLAWTYVAHLPTWDDPAHNRVRDLCLGHLAAACMKALKQRAWTPDELRETRLRLLGCQRLAAQIAPCVRYIDKLLESLA